jgi:hypothetical protein
MLVCVEKRYRLSNHVRQYIEEHRSAVLDILHCIQTAKRINKKEIDEKCESVDGFKYTITGYAKTGQPFYTLGKIKSSEGSEIYYFISAKYN